MAGFHVDASVLGAGRTDGLVGLLSSLQSTVSGVAADGVAAVFGKHYEDLANTIKDTGTNLQSTANTYAHAEAANLRTMDSQAKVVGNGPDVGYDDKYQLGWSGIALGPTHNQSDPGASIRDKMDTDVKAIDWLFNKAAGHHITDPINAIVGNWTTLYADAAAWQQVGDAWKQIAANTTGFAGQRSAPALRACSTSSVTTSGTRSARAST